MFRIISVLAVIVLASTGCSTSDEAGGSGGTAGTGGSAGAGGDGGTGGVGGTGGIAVRDFQVGTCVRDITPVSPNLADEYEATFGETAPVNHTDPIYMAGFGSREAEGYHDRLWARGVVVESTGGRVAIVSLDLVGYFVNETQTIRDMVSPDSEIDYAAISSTHQHEGPDTEGLWGPSAVVSGIDYGYLDFVNATAADCIDEAAANLEPARMRVVSPNSDGLSMGIALEDDGLGVADGKVLRGDETLAPATEGRIVDSRLTTVQFMKREANEGAHEVIATLVNFASHPESLASRNYLITSDFPHYARERLEAEYGGTAIWVSGDLGVLQGPLDIDVLDPVTEEAAERRTFRFAEVHGTQLAERVIEAIDPDDAGDDAPTISYARTTPVAVPLDNPFFRLAAAVEVLNKRRFLYTDGEPDMSIGKPFPPPFDWIPQSLGDDAHTEVGAIRIGNASFAVVPTELDPQIGETYREAMTGAEHTFIIGLGNDHVGYQVPFDKWDGSCEECAPYLIAGVEDDCPVQPIDCSTVFQNNVGQQLDPRVSEPMLEAINSIH